MPGSEWKFVVYHEGTDVKVEVHELMQQKIYLAESTRLKPLMLIRVAATEDFHYWTSVPPGREKEAEEIGRLIDRHIDANPLK